MTKCRKCKTNGINHSLGEGWCEECDAEDDRLQGRPPARPAVRELRPETPALTLPGVPQSEVLGVLAYLYAEAGVRARMFGSTGEEQLAHNAVRQDIRKWAERYGGTL
jgi:hypothetical protein